jgi:hypothetical protein
MLVDCFDGLPGHLMGGKTCPLKKTFGGGSLGQL